MANMKLDSAFRRVRGSVDKAVLLTRHHDAPVEPIKSDPVVATPAAYEIISDDQLLAELRDQPMLILPRKNGQREIVLLVQ